jgi:hypothetical protein
VTFLDITEQDCKNLARFLSIGEAVYIVEHLSEGGVSDCAILAFHFDCGESIRVRRIGDSERNLNGNRCGVSSNSLASRLITGEYTSSSEDEAVLRKAITGLSFLVLSWRDDGRRMALNLGSLATVFYSLV